MSSSANLELSKGDNIIIAYDVSASMQSKDCPGGVARVDYVREIAKTFAREASKWDEDGIDVLTFGGKVTPYTNVTADKADEILGSVKANEGITHTHLVIKAAWDRHKATGSKQTVLFVFTDGEPSDRNAVKGAIREIAAQLTEDNEHEFAISILTVGNIEPGLQSFLTDLDDNLNAKFDIVDVKKAEEVDFEAAFAGALHD